MNKVVVNLKIQRLMRVFQEVKYQAISLKFLLKNIKLRKVKIKKTKIKIQLEKVRNKLKIKIEKQ